MQPFKLITLIVFLFPSFLITAQDYQLNGKISYLNSRVNNGPIKYVKNVKVSNELSPTRLSDYKGRFELNFIDVDPNSTVNLKIEKEGYEVVNTDVLQNIQISNNPSIRVFLAKKGELEKMEKGLFKFSLRNLAERKDSIFHLLNLKAVSNDNIVMLLENQLGQKIKDEMEAKLLLNQTAKDLEKELPEMVHQMAAVNLDFASKRYQKAFEFFTENQLENAIETLDENELDKSFENILTSIEKAKETPETYQKMLNIRSLQIDNVIESFELKRTLLKLAFRNSEAEVISEKIAKMNASINNESPTEIIKDQNEPEDIVEVEQVVNILLEDTVQLALIDTNWVEVEMEKVMAAKGEEEEMTGDPKAKTILETIPNNSGTKILGDDFENTLFVINERKPSSIPIYEKPTPVLVTEEKVINTSPSAVSEPVDQSNWVEFSDVKETKQTVVSTPIPVSKHETKIVSPFNERIVFTDIIEPNYKTYKITTKTSLRQRATAKSKVLKRLKVGTQVKVIDQVDRYWSKVILNGRVGYVKVLLLEKVD